MVRTIPVDNHIMTSGCKGVCTSVKEAPEIRVIEGILFEPYLSNIRSYFEVPKRYYNCNKEMVDVCDILHAFISAEDENSTFSCLGMTFSVKFTLRQRGYNVMKCATYGVEVETIDQAIEYDWLPDFYEAEKEHGPACSSWAKTMIYIGEDGEMQLMSEYLWLGSIYGWRLCLLDQRRKSEDRDLHD